MKDDIEMELGDKFIEKNTFTMYRVMDFFIYPPTLDAYCGEERIKEYVSLHDYALKNSKTIRTIQADIDKVNEYTESVLDNNKLVYRGGSIDEIFKLGSHHGKTGYHKRGIQSMKGKDFTSTSVFPDIALDFTKHDFIPFNEGIVLEYDVSGVSESDIKAVKYDLRGMIMQYKNPRNHDRVCPLEKFGGYYNPIHIQHAEVHLKKGSMPVVTRAWINPDLDKDKKYKVVKILAELNPDIEIHQSDLI